MSIVRSKIKDILNDNESILVFDVDGVLSLLEFGEYIHKNSDYLKRENRRI